MAKPYNMRQATPDDYAAARALFEERISWLQERGSDQWEGGRYEARLAKRIGQGHTWILEDEGNAIGTATICRHGKTSYWTEEERAVPAFYGWKMLTTVERNGEGLGQLMLHWMQDRAARLDLGYMRWRAWRSNAELQRYYENMGAELVRILTGEGRDAGALWQLPAKHFDLSAELTTVEDPTRLVDTAIVRPVVAVQ